jgi:hypothetical protein
MNKHKLEIIGILGVVLLLIGTALATDDNLPGGTSISVDITAPSDGAVKVYPPGIVELEGTASVGEGLPVADTLIVYVLDVSGSTDYSSAGSGCGGDQNGDSYSDTILDCEIAAAKALNEMAVTTETVGEVGVAVYATYGATGDVDPAGGEQLTTGPATDANNAGGRDVEQVLSSAFSLDAADGGVNLFTLKEVGYRTSFSGGLTAALQVASASTKPNKIIVFMSDGLNNEGPHVSTVSVPAGVIIHTFAIGSGSSCTSDPNDLGSLEDVAKLSDPDGTCTPVPDVASLPDIVPGVIAAQLLSLEHRVDGGAFMAIGNDYINPDLPVEGPISATFGPLELSLAPGIHELCVRATGSDAGGEGSVTECIAVTIATIDLTPETEVNELPTPDHTVTAKVEAGAGVGVPGVEVTFEVLLGPNAGESGSGTTDSNGEATFTYTAIQGLDGLGTDTIEACFSDEQGDEVCDTAIKDWVDTTPPEAECLETVNPHGKKVPPAGSTTLPGPKGGQNEDGFYELIAIDLVDPNPKIFVVDTGSGIQFGPFVTGTKIKYTEDPDATPVQKTIGSSKGQAGAIDWHIIGNGDADLKAVDFSDNVGWASCLVPPPPK